MTDAPVERLGPVDAFQLGYLVHFPHNHIRALEPLVAAKQGAAGELASRVEQALHDLRERGPEIVSCVWQVEDIFAARLGVRLPEPPASAEQCVRWSATIREACSSITGDAKTFYAVGAFVGAAEQVIGYAGRLWRLWSAATSHPVLSAAAAEVRDQLRVFASIVTPDVPCPTVRGEVETIAREVAGALEAAERSPDDASAAAFAEIRARLGASARALESAAWGTPRASVRAWHDKKLPGRELAMRLATHQRWTIPVRMDQDGERPRIFAFDKRVLFGLSDPQAFAERSTFLREQSGRWGEVRGSTFLSLVPNDGIDLVVIDPGSDPSSPLTVNYPREMHAMLHDAARDGALQCAFTDWSQLEVAPLRAHQYWVLVTGSAVSNLVAPDGYGRPRVAVFTTEQALDAHLARQNPETRAHFAKCQRLLLPGEVLFPRLLTLEVAGIAFDPSGPGRSRALNKPGLERLARPL